MSVLAFAIGEVFPPLPKLEKHDAYSGEDAERPAQPAVPMPNRRRHSGHCDEEARSSATESRPRHPDPDSSHGVILKHIGTTNGMFRTSSPSANDP